VALGVARAIGWVVVVVVALVGSLLLHLYTDLGRRTVCAEVLSLVNAGFEGSIAVGECTNLTLGSVALTNIEVLDPDGRPVAGADEIVLDPDTSLLLRFGLRAEELRIVRPWVSLRSNQEDVLAIAAAFAPTTPTPPDQPSRPPPDIGAERIVLVDGRVEDIPHGYSARSIDIVLAELDFSDNLVDLRIESADAEVHDARGYLARLERLDGTFSIRPGDRSELSGRVTAEDGELDLVGAATWGETLPTNAHAEVTIDVEPALLTRLGIENIEATLTTGVRGTITVDGWLDDATVTADLESDGGPFQIDAHVYGLETEPYGNIRFETAELDLGEITPALDGLSFHGIVEGGIEPTEADGGRPITLLLKECECEPWMLPELTADGRLYPDRVELASLGLPHLTEPGGHLTASGTYHFEESRAEIDLDARIPDLERDSNLQHLVPGLRGGVTADIEGTIVATDAPTVDLRGFVAADGLAIPGTVRVGAARAEGFIRGPPTTPTVEARVTARDVVAGEVHLETADVRLAGDPDGYRANGTGTIAAIGEAQPDPVHVALDLGAVVRGEAYVVNGDVRARGLWPEPLVVNLRDVAIDPAGEVRVGRIAARGPGIDLEVDGAYRFTRGASSALDARIDDLDLETFAQRFGLDLGLTGRASGTVRFTGTPDRPDLAVDLRLADAVVSELAIEAATLEGTMATSTGELDAEIGVELGDHGSFAASARASFPARRPIASALPDARWEATVTAQDLQLELLEQFMAEGAVALRGKVDAQVDFTGTLDEPTIALQLVAADVLTPDVGPVSVGAEATLAGGRLEATVALSDRGPLGEISIEAPVDLRRLIDGADPAAILDEAWEARVVLHDRRLDRLPPPLYYALPMRVAGEIVARGPLRSLEADVTLVANMVDRDLAFDRHCDEPTQLATNIDVSLRNAVATIGIAGRIAGTQVLTGELRVDTPVVRWMQEGLPAAPPALSGAVSLEEVQLARIPGVCTIAAGTLGGQIDVSDLFTASPRVVANLVAGALRAPDAGRGAGADLSISAEVGGELARAELTMDAGGRRAVEIEGRVPIVWNAEQLVPILADGSWAVRGNFDHAPIAPLLAPVPFVAQPRGALHGRIHAQSRGSDIDASGALTFENISFTWTDPVIRVDDLTGQVSLSDRGLAVRDVVFRDLEGTGTVNGTIGFRDDWLPNDIDLRLETDALPLRNAGVIVATIDGDIRATGDLSAQPSQLSFDVRRFAVQLPPGNPRQLQPLDQHVDVVYENQPGFLETDVLDETDTQPALAGSGIGLFPMRIRIDATEPFWARREDFAMQITADLTIDIERQAMRITGPVRIRRGYIDLLTKTFELEPSEIRFTGSGALDPALDITAFHALSGSDRVTVHIGGRLSEPELSFSSTVPGAETEAQILALLVRGGGGSGGALENQAVGAITGLTAGLLSGLARAEYGEYIPILSIESGGAGGTRVRAGIEADRLIPEFLRGLVQGAYFEGFVGTQGDETGGGQSATGGFLLELYFPHDLTWRNTYQAPSNGSTDLLWEP
jgi:autotransporter translocation and assembly factor TamB